MGGRDDHLNPDLADVDVLCRLVLAARRVGCRVLLADVEPDLAELLDLAGVGDVIVTKDER